MAKASESDLEMALDLSGMLESFERGYFPLPKGSEDDEAERFDRDDNNDCYRAMEMILDTLRGGSLFRVTFGMLVLCDPRNEMIDPHLSYLEHHPDAKWARERRGELIEALNAVVRHADADPFEDVGLVVEHSLYGGRIRAARDREATYGLIRYLAGGAFA